MASNTEDTRRAMPGEDGGSGSESNSYRDSAPAEPDLAMLFWAHSEQWLNWLQSVELRGKLVLLKLIKTLVFALLLVLTVSSAWMLALATLVVALANAGVPLAAALALATLLMAVSAWAIWRRIAHTIRDNTFGNGVSTSLETCTAGHPNKHAMEANHD